jgi:integrase
MANKKVTLVLRCKTDKGWRYHSAIVGKNGRIRPQYTKVNGKVEHHPEGHYEGRYYEGSKVRYLSNLGTDAAAALAACEKFARTLVLRESADLADAKVVEEPGRVNLRKARDKFIQAAEDRGSMVAAPAYSHSVDEWLKVVGDKRFADEIETDDLLRYQREMRKQGYSPRTIHNRDRHVVSFLRSCGLAKDKLPARAPRFENKMPGEYTQDELDSFFESLKETRHIVTFKLALQAGLREQELMHLEWTDINFNRRVLRVTSKPAWGFVIKDKDEREVPIGVELLDLLSSYKKACKGTLVTGTSGNKPDTKLLRTLKRLVKKAGLNCKACKPCQTRGECERWYLHKFRSTCITRWLRAGIDLRTVMQLSGHSDLESVMRYLRPAEGPDLRRRLDAITW